MIKKIRKMWGSFSDKKKFHIWQGIIAIAVTGSFFVRNNIFASQSENIYDSAIFSTLTSALIAVLIIKLVFNLGDIVAAGFAATLAGLIALLSALIAELIIPVSGVVFLWVILTTILVLITALITTGLADGLSNGNVCMTKAKSFFYLMSEIFIIWTGMIVGIFLV
jgi:hypothetical protein